MIDLYNLCRVLKKTNVDVLKLETKDVDSLDLPFKLPKVKSKYYFHKTFGDKVELEKYVKIADKIDKLDEKDFTSNMHFILTYLLCDTKFGFKVSYKQDIFKNLSVVDVPRYLHVVFDRDTEEVINILKERCELFNSKHVNIYNNVHLTTEMNNIAEDIYTCKGLYTVDELISKFSRRFAMFSLVGAIVTKEYYEDSELLESVDFYSIESVRNYVKEVYPDRIRFEVLKTVTTTMSEYFYISIDTKDYIHYIYYSAIETLTKLGVDDIENFTKDQLKELAMSRIKSYRSLRLLYTVAGDVYAFEDREEVHKYLQGRYKLLSDGKLSKDQLCKSLEYLILNIGIRACGKKLDSISPIDKIDIYNIDIVRYVYIVEAKTIKNFSKLLKYLGNTIEGYNYNMKLDIHSEDFLIYKNYTYKSKNDIIPNYIDSKYNLNYFKDELHKVDIVLESNTTLGYFDINRFSQFALIEKIVGKVLFPKDFNIFSKSSMDELINTNRVDAAYLYTELCKHVANYRELEKCFKFPDKLFEMLVICNLNEKNFVATENTTVKDIQNVLNLKKGDLLYCVLLREDKPFKGININNVLSVNKYIANNKPVPVQYLDENTKHLVMLHAMRDENSQYIYSTKDVDIYDEESLTVFGRKNGIIDFYNKVQYMLEKEVSKVDFAPILMFKDRDKSLQYYICKEGSEFKEGTYKPLSIQFSIYDEYGKFDPVYYECIYDKDNRVINIKEYVYSSNSNRLLTVDRLTGDRVKGDRDLLFVIPYYQFLCSTNTTQEELEEKLSSKSSSNSITLYYYDTRIVRVQESKEPVSTHKGGKHRFHKSPNEHVRKAHDRVMKSGKVVHIPEMKINRGKGLTIRKKEN